MCVCSGGSPTTCFSHASRTGGVISSGISALGQRLKRIMRSQSKRSLGDADSLAQALSIQRAAGSGTSQASTTMWSRPAKAANGGRSTPHGQLASYIQQQACIIQLDSDPLRSDSPGLVDAAARTAAASSSWEGQGAASNSAGATVTTALNFTIEGDDIASALGGASAAVMCPFSSGYYPAVSRRNSLGSVASYETSRPSQAAGSCVMSCGGTGGGSGIVRGMWEGGGIIMANSHSRNRTWA